jgi:hypothetical protein
MIPARVQAPDLGGIVERCDYWRRSPASAGGPAGHKEWSYFCVLADEVQLVTAFSIMDRLAPAGAGLDRIEEARVTLLGRFADRGWRGAVEACEPATVALQAGRVGALFGRHALAFERGAYRLDVSIDEPPMRALLALRPTARPAMTRSIPLGEATPMQWFVVPRLEASGEVRLGDRRYHVRECPAYHDHNWGRFRWGGDFAWEWGIALSDSTSSWSLIYYRITDRGRHAVVSQGLLLWIGDGHSRTFRDSDLRVRSHGRLRTAGCLRVPRVMQLVVSGSAGDLPTRLEVSARRGHDALDVGFDLESCAQICLPDDDDSVGVTSISECPARATVSGRVDGRAVAFSCHSVIEFNRGAA